MAGVAIRVMPRTWTELTQDAGVRFAMRLIGLRVGIFVRDEPPVWEMLRRIAKAR